MNNHQKIGKLITTVFVAFATVQLFIGLIIIPLTFAYTSAVQPLSNNAIVSAACEMDVPTNTAFTFNGNNAGIAPGGNTGPAAEDNYSFISDSLGNTNGNILLGYQADWTDPGVASFNGQETNWAATSTKYVSMIYNVTPSLKNTNVVVFPGLGSSITGRNVLYFALGVPAGTVAGTYTSNLLVELTC